MAEIAKLTTRGRRATPSTGAGETVICRTGGGKEPPLGIEPGLGAANFLGFCFVSVVSTASAVACRSSVAEITGNRNTAVQAKARTWTLGPSPRCWLRPWRTQAPAIAAETSSHTTLSNVSMNAEFLVVTTTPAPSGRFATG